MSATGPPVTTRTRIGGPITIEATGLLTAPTARSPPETRRPGAASSPVGPIADKLVNYVLDAAGYS